VREIFTGDLGDNPDLVPSQTDAGDAEYLNCIKLDESPILNDSLGKEISFTEPVKSTNHTSGSPSFHLEPAKKDYILQEPGKQMTSLRIISPPTSKRILGNYSSW
jgi:hypothetical protein